MVKTRLLAAAAAAADDDDDDIIIGNRLLQVVASRLRLRFANQHQLIVPRCQLSTYRRLAFSIAGPTVWNSLPDELTDPARSFDSFRQFLKTILFSLY